MFIAGEASGDLLAAELVNALRAESIELGRCPTKDVQPLRTALEPEFFGAGGPRMTEAGVQLAFEMTQHAVIGLTEPLRKFWLFRKLLSKLVRLAIERKPDVIVCVDFFGFNHRFAHAVRRYVRKQLGWFQPWNPKIVQYVSPQVWASRPGRVRRLGKDYDLVLSILPFERAWYAEHAPDVRVKFVGHPICDRLKGVITARRETIATSVQQQEQPMILLLPGSRLDELRRHLPVMLEALELIKLRVPGCAARMVLADESIVAQAKSLGVPESVDVASARLYDALGQSTIAIAKSGTVTLECAMFGVPAVVIYKTSWPTYLIGKKYVTVKHLAMPNLLAGEEIMPELIQAAATPHNIARVALDLLSDPARRLAIKRKLLQLAGQLGGPGAPIRAAQAIMELLQ